MIVVVKLSLLFYVIGKMISLTYADESPDFVKLMRSGLFVSTVAMFVLYLSF